MKWRNRQRSRNIDDRRKLGGKKSIGGGLAFIGFAIVVGFMGGDPSKLLQEGVSRTLQSAMAPARVSSKEQDQMVDFVSVVLAETETTWDSEFKRNDLHYNAPTLVFFNGSTQSGCGFAQSVMGPFYCPLDKQIYIDVSFFNELKNHHNAAGDFAQAYVIAHEVGHHIQGELGLLDAVNKQKRRASKTQANKLSVQVELMADCLAGVWANDTRAKGLLEEGDIKEALNAATQIGDDRLQKKSHGHVVPDSFTHGTGEQRYGAFKRGFEGGKLKSCLSS